MPDPKTVMCWGCGRRKATYFDAWNRVVWCLKCWLKLKWSKL